MKIIIAAGGTAGHINPALAIAQIIRSDMKDADILFIGTPDGMENRLVKNAGYKMRHITVRGLERKLSFAMLKTISIAIRAKKCASHIFEEEAPDLVIGTGGFVCYPALSAAVSRGIPSLIHESNVRPGLSVKLLAPRVNTVLTQYTQTAEYLSRHANCIPCGFPVKADFRHADRSSARRKRGFTEHELSLLSFGGSLGADRINETVLTSAPDLLKKHPNLHITHVTGMAHFEKISAVFKSYSEADKKRMEIYPYLDNMAAHMAAADLVISRSGAATLAEEAVLGIPAILIPYPFATDDHQTANARGVEKAGGAICLPERELTVRKITELVSSLLSSPGMRREMSRRQSMLAPRDSEWKILSEIKNLLPSLK